MINEKTKVSIQLSILFAVLVATYRLGFVHANMERTDIQQSKDYERLHELVIQEVGGLRSDVNYYVNELKEENKETREICEKKH